MLVTDEKFEGLPDGFLENLIDQASFIQDILAMIETILEKVQKNIYILLDKLRE